MAEGGDIPKEIPDFEPTDLDDDVDRENMEMDPISSTTRLINPDDDEEEETSFGGRNYEKEGARPKLPSDKYDNRMEALKYIKRLFPDFNPLDSPFTAEWDKEGNLFVKLSNQRNAAEHILIDKDGVIKLDKVGKTIIKALGADYESMLIKNNNLLSQLNEANEQNMELLNVVQGLEATTKVYPMEISRYEEKEKELRQFAEKQQVEKTEIKSLFDATVKQNIELKIQKEKLLNEVKLYKDEIDKYKKGKLNLSKLEQSKERLQSENDKLRELARKSFIYNQEQKADLESKNEEILKNLPLRETGKVYLQKVWFYSLCCFECCWCSNWCYSF